MLILGLLIAIAGAFLLFAWLLGRAERETREIREQVERERAEHTAQILSERRESFQRGFDAAAWHNLYTWKFPDGMTRRDCIDGLKGIYDLAVELQKEKDGAIFVGWPDLVALLNQIDHHGFPPPNHKS